MNNEALARALGEALSAEGASVLPVGGADDLARVRLAGEVDLRAVAERLTAASRRPRRTASPLHEPPTWLRPYP